MNTNVDLLMTAPQTPPRDESPVRKTPPGAPMKRDMQKRLKSQKREKELRKRAKELRKILSALPVARNQPFELNLVAGYLGEELENLQRSLGNLKFSSFKEKPVCARVLRF